MEESGKQNSIADMRDANKNCMESGVIPKQEVLVGDQLSSADEELIIHYLEKKMIDQRFPNHAIHEVDFFLYHPQQLSEMHGPSQAEEWYFLSPASEKYTVGGQSNNANNDGYWEPCGADCLIHKDGNLIGYGKTLNYIEGKHEEGKRTDWVMHEYRLERSRDVRTGTTSEGMKKWVFCKLFKLNDRFIAAGEKEAFATIQGLEKANNIINDKRPSAGLTGGLLPIPDTEQGTAAPHSSSKLLDQACKIWSFDKPLTYSQSQHDQGTIRPTPTPQHGQITTSTPSAGRGKATKKVVNNKRPSNRRKRGSDTLPESDPGSMMAHFLNANSGPQRDQGTLIPPLPQNDQRTVFPTCTGPHNAYSGVVINKSPNSTLSCDSHPVAASSQGLMIPCCFYKILDRPTGICSFDGTIANSRHQHGALLPSHLQRGQQTILPRPQHDQQTVLPALTGIHDATNDEVSVKRPTLDNALNLPPADQVPKLPPMHGSVYGSHDNEAAVPEAPRYGGWPFYNPERSLEPYDELQSLTEDILAFFDQPDPGYPQAYENKKETKDRK